jgi:hypothetical protein
MPSTTPSAITATPSRRPSRQTLDDGARERVDDRLEGDALAELLGNEGQGRAGRLADAERQMTGLPPHRRHEEPVRRRLRVDHQVLHELDADVARGLEPEGVDVGRQIEVVVDRLGHVHDAQAARRVLDELHRRVGGVVAADGDELRDAEAREGLHGVLEQRGIGRRVGARDPRCEPPRK